MSAFVGGGNLGVVGTRRSGYTTSTASSFSRRCTVNMAVSKKSSYRIAVLPGDGIGPEISAVTVEVMKAVGSKFGFSFEFTERTVGGAGIDASGEPLPAETLEVCKKSDSILLAAIGKVQQMTEKQGKLGHGRHRVESREGRREEKTVVVIVKAREWMRL